MIGSMSTSRRPSRTALVAPMRTVLLSTLLLALPLAGATIASPARAGHAGASIASSAPALDLNWDSVGPNSLNF